MADEDDAERRMTERADAGWQQFLDLVPPQRLAEPAPKPVPEPAPKAESDAKARAIQLQILKDRQVADDKIFEIQRKAQEDAFVSLQAMHDKQNEMKL